MLFLVERFQRLFQGLGEDGGGGGICTGGREWEEGDSDAESGFDFIIGC